MKLNTMIFTSSLLVHCSYSLAVLPEVKTRIHKRSNINCSIFMDEVTEEESSAQNEAPEGAAIIPDANMTNVCIATYVGENTTVISKLSNLTSSNLASMNMHLELLNKSALRTQSVLHCDLECEEKFDVGRIYVYRRSQKDPKYFLEYYTNYRCIEPDPPMGSMALVYYLRLVSLFFMLISLLTCAFYPVKFFTNKNLRTLPGFCILSLCIAVVIVYPCFFAMKLVSLNKNGRFVCGLYLYTTLAHWFWINVITFDLWKTIRLAVVKFRRPTNKSLIIRFIYYSIYAWGMPSILTFIVVYPLTLDQRLVYHLGFSSRKNHFAELYIAIPLLLLQLSNFILFYSSFYMIFKGSKSSSESEQSEVSKIKQNFLYFLRMSFIMGIIWITGMIGYFAKIEILTYIYIYAKILEGPYVVLSYAACGRSKDCCRSCCCLCSSTTDSETTSL